MVFTLTLSHGQRLETWMNQPFVTKSGAGNTMQSTVVFQKCIYQITGRLFHSEAHFIMCNPRAANRWSGLLEFVRCTPLIQYTQQNTSYGQNMQNYANIQIIKRKKAGILGANVYWFGWTVFTRVLIWCTRELCVLCSDEIFDSSMSSLEVLCFFPSVLNGYND